jgi:hypothetical protein
LSIFDQVLQTWIWTLELHRILTRIGADLKVVTDRAANKFRPSKCIACSGRTKIILNHAQRAGHGSDSLFQQTEEPTSAKSWERWENHVFNNKTELFELSFEPLTLQRNLARADTEMFMRPFTFHLGAALSIVILKQLHAASLQLPCSFRWYTYHSDSWDECEHEGAASQQKETPDLLI